jgi:hypothetical protein
MLQEVKLSTSGGMAVGIGLCCSNAARSNVEQCCIAYQRNVDVNIARAEQRHNFDISSARKSFILVSQGLNLIMEHVVEHEIRVPSQHLFQGQRTLREHCWVSLVLN